MLEGVLEEGLEGPGGLERRVRGCVRGGLEGPGGLEGVLEGVC